ncbi:adenosylcobinamide-phosphate synthase CbiB [Methylocystis echinoides]|uniref:adenosylcobinamide-phosphate synthase CbiB n=1 Tax=Methylocystis echinoides TaxID=29468 RepID=UPI003417DEA3
MSFGVAVAALAIEAVAGYPEPLFKRIGHPVTWIGALIARLDRRLNRAADPFPMRRGKGVAALLLIVAAPLAAGEVIERLLGAAPYGALLTALLASALLAQRSLYDHVAAVARELADGLDAGRREVAKIVGRDVAELDEAGVARAAIESLAENFSDGVVAPALFLALFGLPGALVYKAVNTADSMIGHKSERYLAFGWAAARCDDLFNLVPARIAAGLIAAAAAATPGASGRRAFAAARADAAKHASPNAGWPEAAMAGALGLALGGPRAYRGATVDGAVLGEGLRAATTADIFRALTIYKLSAAVFWLILLVGVAAGVK